MHAKQAAVVIACADKDDFEHALRAHKKSQDETKSERRDKAAAATD